jgi:hypothetical protein
MKIGILWAMPICAALSMNVGSAAVAQQQAARVQRSDINHNTSRVRSLLEAQAASGLAARASLGRPPSAQARGAPGRTVASMPALASASAVSPIAVRPVRVTAATNATAKNSRIGGPYAGGHATIGGPAVGRTTNAGKIGGTPMHHGP